MFIWCLNLSQIRVRKSLQSEIFRSALFLLVSKSILFPNSFLFLVMETLKQIDVCEAENELSDEQRRALFEKRMQIFLRIHQWREENKKLGLEPTISDEWTPQQRESFLRDWLDGTHGEKP